MLTSDFTGNIIWGMVPIEEREYQAPVWEEFNWYVWGQSISGVMSELPESTRDFRRVRVAVAVAPDAENVTIGISQRNRIDYNPRGTRRIMEECWTISYWSPSLRVGQSMVIPRELAQRADGDLPEVIVVERVEVYSYNNGNLPTYNDLR